MLGRSGKTAELKQARRHALMMIISEHPSYLSNDLPNKIRI
jgi:hypothetical protein